MECVQTLHEDFLREQNGKKSVSITLLLADLLNLLWVVHLKTAFRFFFMLNNRIKQTVFKLFLCVHKKKRKKKEQKREFRF